MRTSSWASQSMALAAKTRFWGLAREKSSSRKFASPTTTSLPMAVSSASSADPPAAAASMATATVWIPRAAGSSGRGRSGVMGPPAG